MGLGIMGASAIYLRYEQDRQPQLPPDGNGGDPPPPDGNGGNGGTGQPAFRPIEVPEVEVFSF